MKANSKVSKSIDINVAESKKPEEAPKLVDKTVNIKNKSPAKKKPAEMKVKETEVPATVVVVNHPELTTPIKVFVENTAFSAWLYLPYFVVAAASFAVGFIVASVTWF